MSPRARTPSVDALRGLVVWLMIIVNSVADAPGVPAFTQHTRASVDGLSLADVILPWFLFLVGVSLPLALGRDVEAGTRWAALRRVVPRAAGLILLGVIFVNAGRISSSVGIGRFISGDVWLLGCVAAMIVLLLERTAVRATGANPPPNLSRPARLWPMTAIKVVALLALLALLIFFRGRTGSGRITWLRPSWWGILGIIGWSYLIGALTFLLTRGRKLVLAALALLALGLAVLTTGDRKSLWAQHVHLAFVPKELPGHEYFGSLGLLVLCGTLAGLWLTGDETQRSRRLALFGCGLWLAGALVRPLHGFHKDRSTEGWALVGAAQAALLLALFHAWLDRVRQRHGAWLTRAGEGLGHWLALGGANALLAYLISETFYPLTQQLGIDVGAPAAWGGVGTMLYAATLATAIVALAAVCTRARLRLRL